MNHLVVTPSADGVPRFTMRVEHRVDPGDLEAGLLHHLNIEFGDLCRLHDLELAVARVRRREVLAFTRRLLTFYGTDGGPDLEACDQLRQVVRARVAHLFPEFKTNQKGGR